MDPTLIFLLLIVLLVVPMFLQTRKQRRAMRTQQDMQKSLSVGDRVMTTSGLLGTIVETEEKHVDLEIAEGVITTWVREAVREKVSTDDDVADGDFDQEDFAEEDLAEEESTEYDSDSDVAAEESEPAGATAKLEEQDEVEESKTS